MIDFELGHRIDLAPRLRCREVQRSPRDVGHSLRMGNLGSTGSTVHQARISSGGKYNQEGSSHGQKGRPTHSRNDRDVGEVPFDVLAPELSNRALILTRELAGACDRIDADSRSRAGISRGIRIGLRYGTRVQRRDGRGAAAVSQLMTSVQSGG